MRGINIGQRNSIIGLHFFHINLEHQPLRCNFDIVDREICLPVILGRKCNNFLSIKQAEIVELIDIYDYPATILHILRNRANLLLDSLHAAKTLKMRLINRS